MSILAISVLYLCFVSESNDLIGIHGEVCQVHPCHTCFGQHFQQALGCVVVVSLTIALILCQYNSFLQVRRLCEADIAPVWPHVLDLWCAGLVVVVVDRFCLYILKHALAFVSRFINGATSLSKLCVARMYAKGCSSSRNVGVGHLSRWRTLLVLLLLLHRGEAFNPGPGSSCQNSEAQVKSWSMGTFNPSGLGGKQQVVSSYLAHGDLWAVTETHLTSHGIRAFRQGLKWSGSEFVYCIGGHPVPLRSHSCATGCWNGVAVLSKFPTRAVPVPWGDNVFETSRVQLTATLCEDMWVTGGTLYGEPPGASHPRAQENTDTLALDMVSHLCQLSGLRYFAGDLNFEVGGLEVFKVLEDAGFRDIQDIAFEQWGRPVAKTCKQSTRKDFFFISRELIPFLCDVSVDDTVWADHAVLQGFFSCRPGQLSRYHWRLPKTVEWPESFDVNFSTCFHQEQDPTRKYEILWKEVEQAASHARLSKGQNPLTSKQVGRGSTHDTVLVKSTFHLNPVRTGRKNDVQPLFAGLSQQHAHWFRQLRRLQAFVRFRKVHDTDTLQGHGVSLWSSILRAKGFEVSFGHWWERQASRVFGAPNSIPLSPPPWEVASKVYESFLIDVRSLERNLKSKRCKHAKDKRKELAHLIFRDIRRAAPDRVDVLLTSVGGNVVEIDSVMNSIRVDDRCRLSGEHPIFINGKEHRPIQANGTQVWFVDIRDIQPGHEVRQTVYTGQATELFRTFGNEWSKRWDRHKDVPSSQWEQICNFGRQVFNHQPIDLPSWDRNLLQLEISRKKSQSATGLDGVSISDLKVMPGVVLDAHCSIYQHAEDRALSLVN